MPVLTLIWVCLKRSYLHLRNGVVVASRLLGNVVTGVALRFSNYN